MPPNPLSQDKHNTNEDTQHQHLALTKQPVHMEIPSTSILTFTQLNCKIHSTTNNPSPVYPKPSAQPDLINTITHSHWITISFSTIIPSKRSCFFLHNSFPSLQSNPLMDPINPQLGLNSSHLNHVSICHPNDFATLICSMSNTLLEHLYPGAPNP